MARVVLAHRPEGASYIYVQFNNPNMKGVKAIDEDEARRLRDELTALLGDGPDLSGLRQGEAIYPAHPDNPYGWTVGVMDALGNTAAGVTIADAQRALDEMRNAYSKDRAES